MFRIRALHFKTFTISLLPTMRLHQSIKPNSHDTATRTSTHAPSTPESRPAESQRANMCYYNCHLLQHSYCIQIKRCSEIDRLKDVIIYIHRGQVYFHLCTAKSPRNRPKGATCKRNPYLGLGGKSFYPAAALLRANKARQNKVNTD